MSNHQPTWVFEPTWVFVAGTYRTASTTQYQMTRDIVEETDMGMGIGYHQEKKLEKFDNEGCAFIVCKVFEFLPEGFRGQPSLGAKFLRDGRLKAVVSVRDPRDIIVSMRKRSLDLGKKVCDMDGDGMGDADSWSFRETATINFPVWLGHLKKWANLGPELCLVSYYEQFTTNLYREVQRIAEHLKIELQPDHAKDIAKRYTIPEMERRRQEKREAEEKEDEWLPNVPRVVFGSSGIHNTWLTPPERELVEEANREFMETFGYL